METAYDKFNQSITKFQESFKLMLNNKVSIDQMKGFIQNNIQSFLNKYLREQMNQNRERNQPLNTNSVTPSVRSSKRENTNNTLKKNS